MKRKVKIARNWLPEIFPGLPAKRYSIIYADPPWDYKGQSQHNGAGGDLTGGAMAHYPTLTAEMLAKLPVAAVAAADCLLFMWSSNPHLDQAIDLGKAWGFQWATVGFVWDKRKVNPGYYTMSQCELCLVFKRGRIPRPRGARNIRQLISVERTAHSAKPDEARERIDAMFPGQAKIELFARSCADGWDAWGIDLLPNSSRIAKVRKKMDSKSLKRADLRGRAA